MAYLQLHTIRIREEHRVVVLAATRLTAVVGRLIENLAAGISDGTVHVIDVCIGIRMQGNVMRAGS